MVPLPSPQLPAPGSTEETGRREDPEQPGFPFSGLWGEEMLQDAEEVSSSAGPVTHRVGPGKPQPGEDRGRERGAPQTPGGKGRPQPRRRGPPSPALGEAFGRARSLTRRWSAPLVSAPPARLNCREAPLHGSRGRAGGRAAAAQAAGAGRGPGARLGGARPAGVPLRGGAGPRSGRQRGPPPAASGAGLALRPPFPASPQS